MGSCEVCKEKNHRYKCPKCFLKYCSLSCYKKHRENECRKVDQSTDEETTDHSSGRINSSAISSGETTEDRVSVNKLELLEESLPIREMLENPHLRQIMTEMVNSDNPSQLIEKYMKEPIFLEFVDECLETVDSDDT